MKRLTTAAVAAFLGLALAVSPARAGPAADALGACMAEHTTDKDRTDMMRFVFLGMASHPDFVNFFNITLVDRAEVSQKYADIMTRLMTENCPEQARAAISEGGQAVIGDAFDAM
ncbi:MAG: hypothetical protein LBS70_00290, partial [Candidatus Accumulibacter sp.]|nr:hypothetical protein [Accumulibacter sp.]